MIPAADSSKALLGSPALVRDNRTNSDQICVGNRTEVPRRQREQGLRPTGRQDKLDFIGIDCVDMNDGPQVPAP